jgi:hypothetical protein
MQVLLGKRCVGKTDKAGFYRSRRGISTKSYGALLEILRAAGL